ncbi:hypothetical protein R3W88_009706 [Solanum pinnatisectum]|uniref:Uncharacterized protein n=1 Tax=Solanum pinnatisectum TaxID=50273 RepID=A0AAV9MBP1_9SOLN|nr:hypothetical protein R3W88_009706 [Solanum pinnatisectum]
MSGVRCKFKLILLSVALIGISIWLHFSDSATLCDKVLVKPLLIVGVSALFYWVVRFVESLCRVKVIVCICTISLLLFSLGLICFTVFSILVTNRKVSRALFGRDGDYLHYLLEKCVMNAEQIKSCLLDSETCQHLPTVIFTNTASLILRFLIIDLDYSSCCKPPTYCGLEFHNATYWTMPIAGPAVVNNDCKIWNNVQTELCFKCQSCKTIFYDFIQKRWKILSLLNFVILLCCCVLCYVLYLINNRSKGHPRHKVFPAV